MSATPNPTPAKNAAGAHWLGRLVRCIWWLGPWLGWRYFRLDCRARRDPRLVPAWCDEMERTAAKDEAAGKTVEAAMLRLWAVKCRHYNDKFHSANELAHGTAGAETNHKHTDS